MRINTGIRNSDTEQAKEIRKKIGWGEWIHTCIVLFFTDTIFESKIMKRIKENGKRI